MEVKGNSWFFAWTFALLFIVLLLFGIFCKCCFRMHCRHTLKILFSSKHCSSAFSQPTVFSPALMLALNRFLPLPLHPLFPFHYSFFLSFPLSWSPLHCFSYPVTHYPWNMFSLPLPASYTHYLPLLFPLTPLTSSHFLSCTILYHRFLLSFEPSISLLQFLNVHLLTISFHQLLVPSLNTLHNLFPFLSHQCA